MLDAMVLVMQILSAGALLWGAVLCLAHCSTESCRHMFDEAGPLMSMRAEDFHGRAARPPLRVVDGGINISSPPTVAVVPEQQKLAA